MNARHSLESLDWQIRETISVPGREPTFCGVETLGLSPGAYQFLSVACPEGVYQHQWDALQSFKTGANVCLATGTSSGKTAVFQAAAIDLMEHDHSAVALAVYPLKALGREQEERWIQSMHDSRIARRVGRIDGSVERFERERLLRHGHLICATPDILHAWLLNNIASKAVRDFIRRLRLIVVDEVHSYTGVFGSNSAYLFRRLQLSARALGGQLRFIAASATIAKPEEHLTRLFGLPFEIVDSSRDTSRRYPVDVLFADPPRDKKDVLGATGELLASLAERKGNRFLTFVDSRKATEYISSTSVRRRDKLERDTDDEPERDFVDPLRSHAILPYRAGYEERDRDLIQERLSTGDLRGVVSTSALELGINIQGLTTAVLFGVPRNATSFHQRIGRVGRSCPGEVIVINTGDIKSERVFAEPQRLMNMPPAESAHYLANERIQYIHAMCLARPGGEIDQLSDGTEESYRETWGAGIEWPAGFEKLCDMERTGQIPSELRAMKEDSGETPSLVYSLRDVDSQFKVVRRRGGQEEPLGSMSYDQVLRETYPGAVYYYATQPHRVVRVNTRAKQVFVRFEKRYTTSPSVLPAMIYPNLQKGRVYTARQWSEFRMVECDLQVRSMIRGFVEKRGSTSINVGYPLDASTGLTQSQAIFGRTFFTTGILFAHPWLNDLQSGEGADLASFLLDVFLTVHPFERQDLDSSYGRLKQNSILGNEGDGFIALYDRVYGSLRLTGLLAEGDTARHVAERAIELVDLGMLPESCKRGAEIMHRWTVCMRGVESIPRMTYEDVEVSTTLVEVILPGSIGLAHTRNNDEFMIHAVFYSPQLEAVAYRGRYKSMDEIRAAGATVQVAVQDIRPVPGESRMGFYNTETAEVSDH